MYCATLSAIDLTSSFSYTGMDLDAVGGTERSYLSDLANQAIKRLGGGYMYHFETPRITTKKYPDSLFTERVTALIDHERRRHNETAGNRFETKTFCFITWQPPIEANGVGIFGLQYV